MTSKQIRDLIVQTLEEVLKGLGHELGEAVAQSYLEAARSGLEAHRNGRQNLATLEDARRLQDLRLAWFAIASHLPRQQRRTLIQAAVANSNGNIDEFHAIILNAGQRLLARRVQPEQSP